MVSNFIKAVAQSGDALTPADVPFGEWLPDLMAFNNPGGTEALNVVPTEKGYAPFNDIAPITGLTLASKCRGATFITSRTKDLKLYAGSTGGLFVKTVGTFATLWTPTDPVSDYSYWQFIQFGSELVALHAGIVPLVTDTDGDSLFDVLGGSPPIAKCGARVGDFLVLGNLDNEPDPDKPAQPQRIRWSGFNNIESPWITDPGTQADYQDMPSEGGEVVGITGREFGTIFQEHSISRMTEVGLPTVFKLETVEENRGALCTNGIVDVGPLIYFLAEDGFYVWNGVNSIPIGNNKVNRFFFNNLNFARKDRVVGAHYYAKQCVVWAFPNGSDDICSQMLIYSYKENRWARVNIITEYVVSGFELPTSLDDLLGDLDTDYPISFDDPMYEGGRTLLAAFDINHNYGPFTGTVMGAIIDTAEADAPGGERVFIDSARPLVDATTATLTMQAGVRDQLLGGALTFNAAATQEVTGECSVLAEGRYMKFRVNIPTGTVWTHAQGVQAYIKPAGRA